MPFCKTSYDTTVGKIFDLRKLDLALKEALITGWLPDRQLGVAVNEQRKAVFLIGSDSTEQNVPPFVHPYLIQNFKNQDYLVTDLRSFRVTASPSISDRDFEAAVRNTTEYALVKSRATLGLMWLGPDMLKIRARFTFAGAVFAAWLSQAISKAYALDFNDQLRIMAVSIYYYNTLFQEETRLTDKALEVAVVHTITATKIPAAEVYALFEGLPEINGIEDYCAAVQKSIASVRLQDFNLPMLLTLVKNSWYGTNAKELISVALEHPPTWISIVYITLTERTYKASALYKLIELQGKRGNADEFRMNYHELLKNATVVSESIDDEPIIFHEFKD